MKCNQWDLREKNVMEAHVPFAKTRANQPRLKKKHKDEHKMKEQT